MSAADIGFNFRGCAMNRIRKYKWNWVFGGGPFCAPEPNAFRASCSLKPV